MKLKSTQSGFSLVELMVVVAIIGILATLSIGAIQKQVAKARQSELKTNLSSLYTAQKVFQAEFQSYYDNLIAVNFSVEGDIRYDMGFIAGGTGAAPTYPGVAANPAGANTSLAAMKAANNALPYRFIGGADANTPAQAPAGTTYVANINDFTAYAAGSVYQGLLDEWTIDQTKALVTVKDGLDDTAEAAE